MNSGGRQRGNVCPCVFKGAELGDLAVPERVDVRPLLLDRAARRPTETTLETHDDDGVALRNVLARLELLKIEGFPEHGELRGAAMQGKPVDWEQIFGNYRATVDWPGCTFYNELLERNPDAKVILTVRAIPRDGMRAPTTRSIG